ncbi:hypothetical protein H1R20_g4480, partial [Candolleomyces eurysporus]
MPWHLYGHHLDEWVVECDQFGLKIIAKEAQQYIAAYWARKGQATAEEAPESTVPEFTHDTFIEVLADFIVADNQIR